MAAFLGIGKGILSDFPKNKLILLYTYKYDSFDGKAQEELTTSNFPVALGTQPPIHPRVRERNPSDTC